VGCGFGRCRGAALPCETWPSPSDVEPLEPLSMFVALRFAHPRWAAQRPWSSRISLWLVLPALARLARDRVVTMTENGWEDALSHVLSADSLAAAQLSTSDLIDAAVPGGAVVADSGATIIERIISQNSLDIHRFRAYIIAVLGTMAVWSGIWRWQERQGDNRPSTRLHSQNERAVARALGRAVDRLGWAVTDPDPEVRSMTYRLLAAAGTNPSYARRLMGAAEQEGDDLARACATAAVLGWAVRCTRKADVAGAAEWLRTVIPSAPTDVATRLWGETRAVYWTPEERIRAEHLVRGLARVGDRVAPSWPAESVWPWPGVSS